MDWLQQIRALPPSRRFVQHEPETPRYSRARLKLDYLLHASVLLGNRPADHPTAIEVALWAPPADGRGHGYYSCLRVFRDEAATPVAAVLFCFWDGTEGSRGFRTQGAAQVFATASGFTHRDDHEDNH